MTPEFQQLINDVKAYSPPDNRGPLGEPLSIRITENSIYESAVMYYPVGIVSVLRFLNTSPIHSGKHVTHCVMNEWRANSIKNQFTNI